LFVNTNADDKSFKVTTTPEFYASKIAAEMVRDYFEAYIRSQGREPVSFKVVLRFQELPEYTGHRDGWGRPIDPVFWNDTEIREAKCLAAITKIKHTVRCRHAKRVNGRTKVDH
jgi:hypothetical protein